MIITLVVASAILVALLTVLFLLKPLNTTHRKVSAAVITLLSCFPASLTLYILYHAMNSDTEEKSFAISKAIQYSKQRLQIDDRITIVHIAKISIEDSTLKLSHTPNPKRTEFNSATSTTQALAQHSADLAINGSFFTPFKDKHLLDYYPHTNDPTMPIGQTMSDGLLHGKYKLEWPKLVIDFDGNTYIAGEEIKDTSRLKTIISGRSIIVDSGMLVNNMQDISADSVKPYPRTAVGLSKEKTILWLIVVDGKQPGYSRGLTLTELGNFMIEIGVYNAIELDGGGSSTMAWRTNNNNFQLLSRPSHAKIPKWERPVANHILIYSD